MEDWLQILHERLSQLSKPLEWSYRFDKLFDVDLYRVADLVPDFGDFVGQIYRTKFVFVGWCIAALVL